MKSSIERSRAEIEEYEQKIEETELKLITLQNDIDQLREIKEEFETIATERDATLIEKKEEIESLKKSMESIKSSLEGNSGIVSDFRVKFESLEQMYNNAMIRNKKIESELTATSEDKVSIEKQLSSLQTDHENLQREFTDYKRQKGTRMDHAAKRKAKVDTPHGQTEEIRAQILEQELFDEQKQSEQLMSLVDELKIENSTLSANLQKMKSLENRCKDRVHDDNAIC